MGRPLRIIEPNGIYHVWSRGSNKGQIVWVDNDFRFLLSLVELAAERFAWVVLGYVVMPNHYHLLVRVPLCGLSEGMQLINGTYSRELSRRDGRVRHLFANRFGANLVETQSYLLELTRYLPLNPVLAGLCLRPEDWPWGSFRAMVGLAVPPPFLAANEIRDLFGSEPAQAAAAYRSFVYEGLVRKRRSAVSDTILGLLADLNGGGRAGYFGRGSSL